MVVHSASVINDRALRHSRVLASDELRNTYGFSPRINRELASGVRDMLAAQPGFGINALVRLDPMVTGGVSARLEEVRSNSFGAEKMLARTITKFLAKVLGCPLVDAPPHTAKRRHCGPKPRSLSMQRQRNAWRRRPLTKLCEAPRIPGMPRHRSVQG